MDSATDTRLKETTICSDSIFRGRIINVRVDTVRLPDGGEAKREVVEHPGAVVVVALNDKKEVIMVRQYRQATGEILLELPAGKRDRQEDPLDCARRELEEETGYGAKEWEVLCSFYTSPGFCNELLYLILARGLTGGEAHPDGEEFIDALTIPLNQARRMIMTGEIKDAKTILGIMAIYLLEENNLAD